MLVVFSLIHVLRSPRMSLVVTRMQDLASEFSYISGVDNPDLHSGRGRPPPALTPARPGLWPDAWRKRPGVVGTQSSVPLNFSAVVAPLQVAEAKMMSIGSGVQDTFKTYSEDTRYKVVSTRYFMNIFFGTWNILLHLPPHLRFCVFCCFTSYCYNQY